MTDRTSSGNRSTPRNLATPRNSATRRNRRQRAARRRNLHRRTLGSRGLEPLEQRLLLDAGGLVYLAADDTPLTLRAASGKVQIARSDVPAEVLAERPLAEITAGVRIGDNGHGVRLTIDASVPRIPGGIAFEGSGVATTLVGPAVDSQWHVQGAGSGHIEDAAYVRFTDVGNLLGGADNRDTFLFHSGASLEGVVAGGAGGYDTVVFTGRYASVDYLVTGEQDGSVTLDGATSAATTIHYAGMEPIQFTQTAGTFRYSGTDGDDRITLRDIADSQGVTMEIFGTGETVQLANPAEALIIEAGRGSDTIRVDSLDPGYAADLLIYGNQGGAPSLLSDAGYDTVTFHGDVATHGGYLEVFGDTIEVADGVTLSTLDPNDEDQASDIVFRARRTDTGEIGNLSPAVVQTKSVAIDIGADATLEGAGIYLIAQAEDRDLVAAGVPGLVNQFVIGPLADKVTDLAALPVKLLLKEAEATVTLRQNARLLGTGTVGVYATAAADSTGKAASRYFSIGYGDAKATAIVDVQSGVQIEAGDAALVTSTADATADLGTQTGQELGDSGFAASLAVSHADATSHTTVAEGASIVAGKTANVLAGGSVSSGAEAESGSFADGSAALAFGVGLSRADIRTRVDGQVISRAESPYAVKLEFNPLETDPTQPGYVDFENDRINVGGTALVTEDTVNYDNRRGNSIGGLVDDKDYYVISVEDDPSTPDLDESQYIQLASTEQKAIEGEAIDLTEAGLPIGLNTKTFDAGNVDAEEDTIAIPNPAFSNPGTVDFTLLGLSFELGQAVIYREGTAPIPGLVDGQVYYVIAGINEFDLQGDSRFVGEQGIQLAETENEARAEAAIDIGAAPEGATGYRLESLHILDSGLATGVGIVSELSAEDTASASAGLASQDDPGEETMDDDGLPLGFLDASIFDSIMGALTEAFDDNAPDAGAGAGTDSSTSSSGGRSLGVSGALAFSFADHVVTTEIGGTAQLKSNEDLEVKSLIDQAVQLSAESSSEPQEQAGSDTNGSNGGGTNGGGTTEQRNTTSVAVNVGIYNNAAQTTIETGAELDALRATRVISLTAYGYLTSPDEFFPATLGEFVDTIRSEGYDALNKYLDGTLGLSSELFNSWARSTASSDNVAVAGSASVMLYDNDTLTTVESGALLNQDADWRDNALNPHPNQADQREDGNGEQTVSIEASTHMELINMTGIFGFELPSGSVNPLDPGFDPNLSVNPVASKGTKGGVGGAFYLSLIDNRTHALVAGDAAIFSGADGGFNIKADEATFNVALGQAGANSGKFAVGGTVLYNQMDSDILAYLSPTAVITGRNATVYAQSLGTHVSWAGGVTKGEAIGAGVGAAVNRINRKTRAVIGDPEIDGGAPDTTNNIDVSEGVKVRAIVGGALWSFTVAGAVISDEVDQPVPGQPSVPATNAANSGNPLNSVSLPRQYGSVSQTTTPTQGVGQQTGIGIAAAVSINLVSDDTEASIVDAGLIQADDVSVTTVNRLNHVAATGGAAFVRNPGGTNSSSLAGAFSFNDLDVQTRASLVNTRIAASSLSIESERTGGLISVAAGAAGNSGSMGQTVAGSVSFNRLNNSTVALLDDVAATLSGETRIGARDSSSILAVGGGAALGGATGAGFSVGVNLINSRTEAVVNASTLDLADTGTLVVTADNDNTLRSVGISVGAGKDNGAAFTIGVNLIDNVDEAMLVNSTVTRAAGVGVAARDDSTLQAIGGSLGVGLQRYAFGAALGWNSVSNDVTARIEQSTLSDIHGPVVVEAESSESDTVIDGKILSASVGLAVSGGTSLGGSLSINTVDSQVEAAILSDSSVVADDAMTVRAEDTSSIRSITGAAALGFRGGAFGAAVGVNEITSRVVAVVEDATLHNRQSGLTISAHSAPAIETMAIGGGLAGQFAVGGSVVVNTIDTTVHAGIGSGSEVVAGLVHVQAADEAEITADSFGVGLALSSGSASVAFGISAASNQVTGGIRAYVEDSEIAESAGVVLDAVGGTRIDALTLGGAVAASAGGSGVGVGGAGAGSGNTIAVAVEALVANSTLNGTGNLSLEAIDDSSITANAGALGVAVGTAGSGAGLSLGVAFAKNKIDNQVRAWITDSTVDVGGGVNLAAREAASVEALAIGGAASVGAGSSGVGVAAVGAGSYNEIRNTVEAGISAGSHVTSRNGTVALSAVDASTIGADGGGVGVAVGAGQASGVAVSVGVSAAKNTISNTVRARIDNSLVDAAGDVSLTAVETAVIDALTVGGAAAVGAAGMGSGVGVGAAGAGSGNYLSNIIHAGIANSSSVTSAGDLALTARDDSTITADAGGLSVSVGGAVVAGVAVSVAAGYAENEIRNQVRAFVDDSDVFADSAALTARESATVEALSIGGAIGVGGGGVVGVGFAGAGAVSLNTIENEVIARIKGSGAEVGTSVGDVRLSAGDSATIHADAGGVAAGVGAGGFVGVGVTVGASLVNNHVANTVRAAVEGAAEVSAAGHIALEATEAAGVHGLAIGGAASGSGGGLLASGSLAGAGARVDNTLRNTVEAAVVTGTVASGGSGDILLRASDSVTADAQAIAGALATSFGAVAGSVAVGAAIANNDIGDTVRAYGQDASLASAGALTLDASATITANAQSVAASVATALGGGGFSFSGGGSSSDNSVHNTIRGFLQGGSATATKDVSIVAAEEAALDGRVGAGALAGGPVGASVSVSLADSSLTSVVESFVRSARVSTPGHIVIDASSDGDTAALANATSIAASAVGVAGAGAEADAILTPTVRASSSASVLQAGGDLTVRANASPETSATTQGFAGASLVTVGVSLAEAVNAPVVEAQLGGRSDAAGNVMVEARVNDLSNSADAVAVAVSAIAAGSGTRADAVSGPQVQALVPPGTSVSSGRNFTLAGISKGRTESEAFGVTVGGVVAKGQAIARSVIGDGASGGPTRAAGTEASAANQAVITAGGDILIHATESQGIVADAQGGQGGLIALGGATAVAWRNAPVAAFTGDGAQLRAGRDISIIAFHGYESTGLFGPPNISATADNTSGGLVTAGAPSATSTIADSTRAELGPGSLVDATRGSFTLHAATGDFGIRSLAKSDGGGGVALPKSEAATVTNNPAVTTVGAGANVHAGLNVMIVSDSGVSDSAAAYTAGKGLGTNSQATASIDGSNNSSSLIETGANIDAGLHLHVLAGKFMLARSTSYAEVSGGALGVDASARGTLEKTYHSDVVIQPGVVLRAPGQLQLSANDAAPGEFNSARAVSRSGGFAGDTSAHAATTISKHARVHVIEAEQTADRTRMTTSHLNVAAINDPGSIVTKAERPGFVLINGGSQSATPSMPVDEGQVDFNADVTITGGGAYLYIDAAGNEVARRGVTYSQTASRILVDPILNDGGGRADLNARGNGSRVTGDSTFTFDRGLGDVTLINEDPRKELVIQDIRVPSASQQANLFVSPAHTPPGAFTANVDNLGGTPVSIFGAADIALTGTIENPAGRTQVSAPEGAITSFGPQLLSSQEVTLAGRSIGSRDNRVGVQAVEWDRAPELTAEAAAGDAFLHLSALNLLDTAPPSLDSAAFSGRTVDVLIADSGASSTYEILVAATDQLNADAGIGTPVDISFHSAGDLPIGTIFSRRGDVSLTAGGAITVARPGGTTDITANNLILSAGGDIGADDPLTLNSAYSGPGVVTATAAGLISLDEVAGDLSLSQVKSTGGDILLHAAGQLLDGRTGGSGPASNVDAAVGNVLLSAAQGIGTSSNNLATSVSRLEAAAGTGGLFVTNLAQGLTVSGVTPVVGLSGSSVQLATDGTLTISENIASTGKIEMTADSLIVSPNVAVRSTGSSTSLTATTGELKLLAGSQVTANNATSLSAFDDISLERNTLVGAHPAFGQVTLQGTGNTGSVIGVSGELRGSSARIITGTGSDVINLFEFPAVSTVDVDGGGGISDLLYAQGTGGDDSFSVTGSTIELAGTGQLNYSRIDWIVVEALGGNDTFDVSGTSAELFTRLLSRGSSTLNLATNGHLNAPLEFQKGGFPPSGPTTINIQADAITDPTYPNQLVVTGNQVMGLGLELAYEHATSLNVDLLSDSAGLYLLGSSAATTVEAGGAGQSISVGGGPGTLELRRLNGSIATFVPGRNFNAFQQSVRLFGSTASGNSLEFDNRNGTARSGSLRSESVQGLGEAAGAELRFDGFDELAVRVGDGDFTVVETISAPVTLESNAGTRTDPNTITVLASNATPLSLVGGAGHNEVVFDASTWAVPIDASLGDGSSSGSTDLTGFGPVGSTTFRGMTVARLLTGRADDRFTIDSTVSTLAATIRGGAGDDRFDVHRVGVPEDALTNPISMNLVGEGGDDTVRTLIPAAPSDSRHLGLLYLRSDVEHLVVDNTPHAGAVNWQTNSGATVGYVAGGVATTLLDMSLVDDVDILGGSSGDNALTVNAGGIQQKGTIDGNKVTLQSAGILQFTRLNGTVASYSEGGFTLTSTTAGGEPNLRADDTILPAVQAAHPGSGTPFHLAATDGGLFSLFSLDLSGVGDTTVVGTTARGDTVSQSLSVASPDAFQTFDLNADFRNLVSVSFVPGDLLVTKIAVTQTLRPGVSRSISPVAGTMPTAAQDIVFDDGWLMVDGERLPSYALTTYGAGPWGVFNGTPFTTQGSSYDEFIEGPDTSSAARTIFFFGDLNIPAGSTVTFSGNDALSLVVQNDVNIGADVTFDVPPGAAGGGEGGEAVSNTNLWATGGGRSNEFSQGGIVFHTNNANGLELDPRDGQSGAVGAAGATGAEGTDGGAGSDGLNSSGTGGSGGGGGAGGAGGAGGVGGAGGRTGDSDIGQPGIGQNGQNGSDGFRGADGAPGEDGQVGSSGSINAADRLVLTAGGGGGAGGAGGNGGGGGAGGNGGGGGGGGLGIYDSGSFYLIADGARGGEGGPGGTGKDGGAARGLSGTGGDGGGAFAIRAAGRIVLDGTSFTARGGDGQPGNQRNEWNPSPSDKFPPFDGNDGQNGGSWWETSPGSYFKDVGTGTLVAESGDGGQGGGGGEGGDGGAGGAGGAGAGGGGGTVQLFGTAVYADADVNIDASGGVHGDGSGRGAHGRFQFGSNTDTVEPTLTGVGSLFDNRAGTRGENPYVDWLPNAYDVQLHHYLDGPPPPPSGSSLIVLGIAFPSTFYIQVYDDQGTLVTERGEGTFGASDYPLVQALKQRVELGRDPLTEVEEDAVRAEVASLINLDPHTPLIAGLEGGAQTGGLVADTGLLAALDADGTLAAALARPDHDPTASDALVTVLREPIPAGFDQYSGYDLVLYVNMTSLPLATPRLGITQGGADPAFMEDLQYAGLFHQSGFHEMFYSPHPAPEVTGQLQTNPPIPSYTTENLGAIPAHGIFATLIPDDDATGSYFVNASIAGDVANISGAELVDGQPLYITLPAAAAPEATELRTYSVLFSDMESLRVTATGTADHVINQVHSPSVADLTIDLSANRGNSQVSVLDIPPEAAAGQPQSIRVLTGPGSDRVGIYAAQMEHAFDVDTGAGNDSLTLDADPALAVVHFSAALGTGDDTAQVYGAKLAPSEIVQLDGGPDTDTLLYDADGRPIAAFDLDGNPLSAPDPNNGRITLESPTVATVRYTNFEGVPGFVGPTRDIGGPYVIDQGQTVTLNGTATAATNTQVLSIDWDIDADGVYGDVYDPDATSGATAGSHPSVAWQQLRAYGLGRAGIYPIGMRVTTTSGMFHEYTTLTVQKVAPLVTLDGPASVHVGQPHDVSFSAQFVGDEQATGYTIFWGDGSSSSLPSDATSARHVYTTVGDYTITMRVLEGNFSYPSNPDDVTVVVDATSLHPGGPYEILAGDSLTLTATASGAPAAASWDLSGQAAYDTLVAPFVDNGDGTSTSRLTLTWSQLQAAGITDLGTYGNVTVRADYPLGTPGVADGFLVSPPTSLTVSDVAPTAVFSGTAVEGGTGSVSFTNPFHPSDTVTAAGFRYSYDFGNTGVFEVVDVADPTRELPSELLYESGSLAVRGRIANQFGTAREYVIEVPIANRPPIFATFDADKQVVANTPVTLDNVSFTDPGREIISAAIDWGDGTTSVGQIAYTNGPAVPTTGTVSASHVFAYREQPYVVSVTIQDASGETDTRMFEVAVVNPPLSSVTAGPDQTIVEGGMISLTGARFIDPAPPSSYDVSVDWGDGTPLDSNPLWSPPGTPDDVGRVFGSHHYGQDGSYDVTVTVTKHGRQPVSSVFTVTVNNDLPVVDAGPDREAGIGVPVSVNAAFRDASFPVGSLTETFTAVIDWGDGTSTPGQVTVTDGSPGMPTIGTVTGLHQYAGNGPYTVTVSVADGSGAIVHDQFLVSNAPPVVTTGSPLIEDEGNPVTLNATFSDLGFEFGTTSKSFTAVIDWGDGSSSPGELSVTPGSATEPTAGTITATHTYGTFGTFPITVRVIDEGDAVGEATLTAVIGNLPPIADPLPAGALVPDSLFLLTGTFTDPGLLDTHSVSIEWGDGTTSYVDSNTEVVDLDGNPFTALVEPTADAPGRYQLGHVYADLRDYTVTVTVTDNGGLSSQTSRVYSPRPTLTGLTPPHEPREGTPLSGPVATFTAPGYPVTDFEATIQWGDGTSSTVSGEDEGIWQNPDGSFTISASHVYLDNVEDAPFEVTILNTSNGTSDTGRATLDVLNVPPELAVSAGTSSCGNVGQGQEFELTVDYTDLGSLDSHTALVAWGDGNVTTVDLPASGGAGQFTTAHVYASGGVYEVKVTLTDKDGDWDEAMTEVLISGAGVQDGVLHVIGSPETDFIVLQNNNAGQILVRQNNFTHGPFAEDVSIIVQSCDGNDYVIVAGHLLKSVELHGGAGDDYLAGGRLGDVLYGGAGDDRILTGEGDNFADGGEGDDRIAGRDGNDTFLGGPGRDILVGGGGDDFLDGGEGDDLISGGFGDDLLVGAEGNDILSGYHGNDLLLGGSGQDRLYGGMDDDVLLGGAERDLLSGSYGDDLLAGSLSTLDGLTTANREAAQANDAALRLVLEDWRRRTFDTDLLSGDDGVVDDLFGGLGADDFHACLTDLVRDFRLDDRDQLFESP